jgi:aspartyl protease family protein
MVDSGASSVAIPEKVARIAGIRAGLERVVHTAAGSVRAGVAQGNTVGVGPIGITGVEVVVIKNLDTPLLGASVLDQFRMQVDGRGMTLVRKQK